MPIFDFQTVQGSPDWYSARRGLITASNFDAVMTPKTMKMSESRWKYACRLIAERIMNYQAQSLDGVRAIEEGRLHEPNAVAKMELVFDIASEPVGLVRSNDGRFGASPDRVAGVNKERTRVDTVIEVKCPQPLRQFETLLLGDNDSHRCQRQGQLWVAEADRAIYFSFNPRMPDYMVETGRDEPFIRKLSEALDQFSDELEGLHQKAISLGAYQIFEQYVTPVERDLGGERSRFQAPTDQDVQDLIDGKHPGLA